MKPANNIVLVRPGKDNIHSGPDAAWFEQLESNLGLVLEKYAGERLQSITPEDKEAQEIVGKAVVIIPVLHRSYPASGQYIRFLAKSGEGGKDQGRLYIRLDTSFGNEEIAPQLFAGAASVEMYEVTRDQSIWIGEESDAYWSKLLDLASEVKSFTGTGSGPVKKDATIYLAQVSNDMSLNRNIVKRELIEHGFRVVPEGDLGIHAKDLKSYIQNLVDGSHLAIQILGNAYGEVMKDSADSIAEAQERYISSYLEAIENDPVHAKKKLSRLIWIDPGFNPVDSRQKEFVSRLKRNIEKLHRTEIIQTPLELFKTLVINRLRKDDIRMSVKNRDDSTDRFIYIIHSPDEQKEAEELSEAIKKEGLPTGMLDYRKDQVSLLNDHKRFLTDCEGAVVCYGRPNRSWLRSKVMDLLKAPGMGRERPLQARHVLAVQMDTLEDYAPPSGISVIRESDLSKAAAQLVKTRNNR